MLAFRGIVLLAGCAALIPAADAQEPTRSDLLVAIERQLKDTAATAGPSIACIVVSRSEFYPKTPNPTNTPGKLGGFDPKAFLENDHSIERVKLAQSLDLAHLKSIPDHGYAGGVVIDPAGYVLTPYHVIDGATRVYVYLSDKGGSYADIQGADARSDLAVLKLITPPEKLTAIKFADVRTTAIGDKKATVFAGKLCVLMTNPYSTTFGLKTPSAAFGSITSVRHRFEKKKIDDKAVRFTEYAAFLEYDVKLNSSVTGGVLLNLDGEMIGMTNANAVAYGEEIGAGYAIPADDHFRRVVGVLRKGEEVEYGFLGVTQFRSGLAAADPRAIDPIPKGAAAEAGIMPGDIVKKINGVPVDDFDGLLLHIGSALAGSKVTITVNTRFGRDRDVEVTLAKAKNEQPFIASVRPEPMFGLRVDYSSILAQQRPLGNMGMQPPLPPVPAAVWVRDVAENSQAATKFKTLGDDPTRWLIRTVNGVPVTTPAEFYKAAKGQEKLKLTLTDSTEVNPSPRELTLP
jgi:serine protease Do